MATFQNWEAMVLHLINAPVTQANVAFLDTWQQHEGGSATNNPLNTTQVGAGATNYNSVGVKNYPTPQVGAVATAQTLLNGRYGDVVKGFRSGDAAAYAKANPQPVAAEVATWGTHSFASEILGGALHQAGTPGIVQSIPGVKQVEGIAGGVSSVGDFLGRLTDPRYILRGLQIVAGGVLVLTGIVLLARQVALAADMPDPVSVITRGAVQPVAAAEQTTTVHRIGIRQTKSGNIATRELGTYEK